MATSVTWAIQSSGTQWSRSPVDDPRNVGRAGSEPFATLRLAHDESHGGIYFANFIEYLNRLFLIPSAFSTSVCRPSGRLGRIKSAGTSYRTPQAFRQGVETRSDAAQAFVWLYTSKAMSKSPTVCARAAVISLAVQSACAVKPGRCALRTVGRRVAWLSCGGWCNSTQRGRFAQKSPTFCQDFCVCLRRLSCIFRAFGKKKSGFAFFVCEAKQTS
jgi:hypothetical protein